MEIETRIEVVDASDDDFDWMLRAGGTRNGYTLPPGGLGDREMLSHVRALTKGHRTTGFRGSWMMLAGHEIVGLCGFHRPPVDGIVELGYSTAPERQGLGHATRAVAALLGVAAQSATIRVVVAETAVANVASQRVLQKNGFARSGERVDPEDGELIVWRYVVRTPG